MKVAQKARYFIRIASMHLALCCLFTACAGQATTVMTPSKVVVSHIRQTTPTTDTNTSIHSLAINVPQKPGKQVPSVKGSQPTVQPTQAPTQPLAPTTSSVTGGAQTAQEQQLVRQLFALINQDRANAGLPPLTWSPILAGTAYNHSTLMVNGCGIAHQCSGEAAPCQRIAAAGINDPACGENIGNNAATPTLWAGLQQIDVSMLNEPEPAFHRRNILSTTHHHIGIGIRISASNQTWMTEDFTDV